jgi:hypothetical protein
VPPRLRRTWERTRPYHYLHACRPDCGVLGNAHVRICTVRADIGGLQKMFQILYGSTAAGLYDQAAKLNAQARTLYLQSSDTYYKANDGMGPVLDALTFVPPALVDEGGPLRLFGASVVPSRPTLFFRLQPPRTTTGFAPVPTGTTSTTARRLLILLCVVG